MADLNGNGAVANGHGGGDLSDIAADAETAELTIEKSPGVPLMVRGQPFRITLFGPGHEATVAANRVVQKNQLRRQQDAERRGRNARERDPEDVERENNEYLAKRTAGWSPDPILLYGKEVRFSREAVMAIYANPDFALTVRAQVSDFINDEQNFFRRRGSPSPPESSTSLNSQPPSATVEPPSAST